MKDSLVFFFRVLLSAQMAFAPALAYASEPHPMSNRSFFGSYYTDLINWVKSGQNKPRFSGTNVFTGGGLNGQSLWLEAKYNGKTVSDFNRIRVGYGLSPNDALNQGHNESLRKLATSRLPYLLESNPQQLKDEMMKTSHGRTRLIYELRWLSDALSVHNDTDYRKIYRENQTELSRQSEQELRKDPRTKHLYSDHSDKARQTRAERATIKSMERLLLAELNEATKTGTRNLILEVQDWGKNTKAVAKWAVRYGVTTFRATPGVARNVVTNFRSLIPIIRNGATQAIDVVDPVTKKIGAFKCDDQPRNGEQVQSLRGHPTYEKWDGPFDRASWSADWSFRWPHVWVPTDSLSSRLRI